MVTTGVLNERLQTYIMGQLESMAQTNPMISFIKPLIVRALNKNFPKITKALDLIADENGNIDIEVILEEMIGSVMQTQPFTFKTPVVGDVEVGGGMIKLSLPLTDKKLVFNHSDLQGFRDTLTAK